MRDPGPRAPAAPHPAGPLFLLRSHIPILALWLSVLISLSPFPYLFCSLPVSLSASLFLSVSLSQCLSRCLLCCHPALLSLPIALHCVSQPGPAPSLPLSSFLGPSWAGRGSAHPWLTASMPLLALLRGGGGGGYGLLLECGDGERVGRVFVCVCVATQVRPGSGPEWACLGTQVCMTVASRVLGGAVAAMFQRDPLEHVQERPCVKVECQEMCL